MATVAHEGNPRNTPDLVVSGTLDGSATLLLEFPVQNIVRPIPSDPAAGMFKASPSDSLKYIFTNFVYGVDGQNTGTGVIGAFEPNNATSAIAGSRFLATQGYVLEYSKKNHVTMSGCAVSPQIWWSSQWVDNNIDPQGQGIDKTRIEKHDLDFKETYDFLQAASRFFPDTPGSRYGEYPSNAAPIFTTIEATAYVLANATGKPFSGVAVCVDPNSTNDNFTGIVDAFNWQTQTEYLFRYKNEPLIGNPTVLASTFKGTDYTANSALSLQASKRNSTGLWRLNWGGTALTNLTDSDIPFYDFDMRVALVNLPSVSTEADDYIVWTEVSGIVYAD